MKADSLWRASEAAQRFTTSHQHPLSWLHLRASCFTATLRSQQRCSTLLGAEEAFRTIKKKKKRPKKEGGLPGDLRSVQNFIFPSFPSRVSPHPADSAAPDCTGFLWNSLQCVSIYSLGCWKGGMWCVFVLLESPAGNVTPLSSCAAIQLIGAVFVFSFQVSVSVAAFALEFYK